MKPPCLLLQVAALSGPYDSSEIAIHHEVIDMIPGNITQKVAEGKNRERDTCNCKEKANIQLGGIEA